METETSHSSIEFKQDNVVYNGDVYYKTSYNGISCIYTLKNNHKYYNFSKVCIDNNRKLNDIVRNKYWLKYKEAAIKELLFELKITSNSQSEKMRSAEITEKNIENLITFEIKGNQNNNEINGIYYHEIFMNFFCEHVNINYAVKVSRLMILINEELHLKNISLEQKIAEQQYYIEEYKKNLNMKL